MDCRAATAAASTSRLGANRHDVTQLLALLQDKLAIAGKPGGPAQHPKSLYADRAYRSEMHSILRRNQCIEPCIALRGQPRGSGIGRVRWFVERTINWLHQFQRPRDRYGRWADLQHAFLTLECVKIC